MRAKEIEVGGRYEAKVSGRIVVVKVIAESEDLSTGRKRWQVENLATGRRIVVRSAQRFRSPAPVKPKTRFACDPDESAGMAEELRTFGDASDEELRGIVAQEEREPGSTGGGASTASAVLRQRQEAM